jgi:cell division septal protein FtsQ
METKTEQTQTFFDKIQEKRKSKKKSVLFLLAILISLAFLSILSINWSSKQAIKNIKISGNIVLSVGEINLLIDELIMNVPKEGIDLTEIRKKLLTNEYIANADVWFNSKGIL